MLNAPQAHRDAVRAQSKIIAHSPSSVAERLLRFLNTALLDDHPHRKDGVQAFKRWLAT
jgi:hypothetical protein